MRLAHFHHGSSSRLGVVVDDRVNDLAASAPDLPTDPLAVLATGQEALDAARRATDDDPAWLPLADVRLLAPVPRPGGHEKFPPRWSAGDSGGPARGAAHRHEVGARRRVCRLPRCGDTVECRFDGIGPTDLLSWRPA